MTRTQAHNSLLLLRPRCPRNTLQSRETCTGAHETHRCHTCPVPPALPGPPPDPQDPCALGSNRPLWSVPVLGCICRLLCIGFMIWREQPRRTLVPLWDILPGTPGFGCPLTDAVHFDCLIQGCLPDVPTVKVTLSPLRLDILFATKLSIFPLIYSPPFWYGRLFR